MSLSNFEILSKLGDGAFSSVFKVLRKSDQQIYALKKVKLAALKQKERENALNEVRILASVTHPNIIAYKEAFIDESANTLCIVMELAEHGDLLKKIAEQKESHKHFTETEIWDAIIQISQGLSALHEADILHRDLKGANIFITKDGIMKLGDLNVSKVSKRGLAYTQTGTPYYASPEVWQDKPYDWRSDIWSLGCVIYEMAALNPPFTAHDLRGLYNRVISGVYPSIPVIYTSDLSSTIKSMLQVRPAMRPSCKDILSMPAVLKRNKHKDADTQNQTIDLLGTIKFDAIKNIQLRLPAANYNEPDNLFKKQLPKIEERIKKIESGNSSQLKKNQEVLSPHVKESKNSSSTKNSLPGSRNSSRDSSPAVQGELVVRSKQISEPLLKKNGEFYVEETKFVYPVLASPRYARSPDAKPPLGYVQYRNDGYNYYPDAKPPVPNCKYNSKERERARSSNSREGSREGDRGESGLHNVGNIILQSPRHQIPKVLPKLQRIL